MPPLDFWNTMLMTSFESSAMLLSVKPPTFNARVLNEAFSGELRACKLVA